VINSLRLVTLFGVTLAAFGWPPSAAAQVPAAFDVASVKATTSGNDRSTSDLLPGGRFRATNRTVYWLAKIAFGMSDVEITGGPSWLRTEGFDIDAKIDSADPMTPEKLKPLLLELLQDRFRLKFHIQKEERPVFVLVAAKSGPKLTAHVPSSLPPMADSMQAGTKTLTASGISTAALAGYLGRQMGRPVLDKTGIEGEFDLTLKWAPETTEDTSEASIYAALSQQLGLRVVPQKAPVSVVVIDSTERPSAN
jgi:uncharacterized protein (TIGR03435 family)